jgi:hypothetical protein
MSILVYAAAVVVLIGVYLTWTANRLDRVHTRRDAAWAALDAQLVRRASVSLDLAASRLLDPAASILLDDAAHTAREAAAESRDLAETNLTLVLRDVFEDPKESLALKERPGGGALLAELDASCRRVQLARHFYNDAVRVTWVLRRQRLVRLFRLAGHAPFPQTFEMDDEEPVGLRALAAA